MAFSRFFHRSSFAALFLIGLFTSATAQALTPLPVLADPNLQACLTEEASQNGWVYAEQAVHLNCPRRGATNLGGIESLSSLAELDLSANAITDVTALNSLRSLTKLNLSGNRALTISQVQPMLSQNYGLTSIGLNGIVVGEFGNLPLYNSQTGQYYNLTELDLGNTKLTFNGTKNLDFLWLFPNLTKLNVAGNDITSTLGLNATLKLAELDLSANAITDVTALYQLRSLTSLNLLGNNQILCTDLDALAATLSLAVIQRPASCIGTNLFPVVDAGAAQSVAEGTNVFLFGSAYDPDGSIASINWTQTSGPTVSLVNGNTAVPSFTAPQVSADTVLAFQLSVTDNLGATVTASTSVTVINVNQPPTASAGASQTVNESTAVTLSGSGTDPDGSIASYQWTQTAGPAVSLTNANTANATFTAPSVTGDTLLTFQLSVTDNDGAAATATTSITVKNVSGVDLLVTSVSGSVTTIKRGSSFSFTSTTMNSGDLNTSTSTTTGLYLSSDVTINSSDTRIGSVSISSLTGGASSRSTRTVTVPSTLAAGTYYLGAIADYTKRQTETNETNNSFTGLTIQVTQ